MLANVSLTWQSDPLPLLSLLYIYSATRDFLFMWRFNTSTQLYINWVTSRCTAWWLVFKSWSALAITSGGVWGLSLRGSIYAWGLCGHARWFLRQFGECSRWILYQVREWHWLFPSGARGNHRGLPGHVGGALDGLLAHLLDFVASICAFWALFLCQLLLSEAKGVALEDSIVRVSINCQGRCSSSVVFFRSQANGKITIKSAIVSCGEIIAEKRQAIFCSNRWWPYCHWQHAITYARKRIIGLTRIVRDPNELISLAETAVVSSNTHILRTVPYADFEGRLGFWRKFPTKWYVVIVGAVITVRSARQ